MAVCRFDSGDFLQLPGDLSGIGGGIVCKKQVRPTPFPNAADKFIRVRDGVLAGIHGAVQIDNKAGHGGVLR
ncbi:hypothetical protein D3C73_1539610 [compost metagenome]